MLAKALHFLLMAVFMLAMALPVWAAEKYPDRPIDFLCCFGVGGGSDQMSRILAKMTERVLGVALPVSNIPGSSGNTGVANLLAAKNDGYTVASYIADTLATISAGQARYKIVDLEWISRSQVVPSFLFVQMNSPFKTIQDLLKFAKENPGKLKLGATGFGTVDDITLRYLANKGYKMTLIPIPGPGERYAATLGGHNEVLYEQAGDIKQYLDAKQLRPIIVFANNRFPGFPDIPCSKELGFDLTLPQFRGVVAKKGVPPDRIRVLAEAFQKAMLSPEWQNFSKEQYSDPESYMGPEQFQAWATSEADTMRNFMKTFGMIK
jgi:tripartite-type tricarboxylate transporter receptor subunit TctC